MAKVLSVRYPYSRFETAEGEVILSGGTLIESDSRAAEIVVLGLLNGIKIRSVDPVEEPPPPTPDPYVRQSDLEEALTQEQLSASATYGAGRVFLSDYVVADGVTDDSPNIVAAFAALVALGGGELVTTPGTSLYCASDMLVTAPDVSIKADFEGVQLIPGSAVDDLLTITGTRTQLGANNAYSATAAGESVLPTTANWSATAGGWVMVWSNDIDNGERATDYLSGEFVRVLSGTSSALTLDRPLRLSHDVGDQRRLYQLNPTIRPTITNLDVDYSADGTRQVALTVRYAYKPHVKNVSGSGRRGRYGVRIDQCIDVLAEDISAHGVFDAASPTAPDGMGLFLNGVQGATVNRVFGRECRHAFDVNSYSSLTLPGVVSCDVVVNQALAVRCYAPGWTTHHARGVTFNEPKSIDCGGGGHVRAYDVTIRKPRIIGGQDVTPSPWDGSRAVHSGISFGESDDLPGGAGIAAMRVYIEDPRFDDLPEGWTEIAYSDSSVDVFITGTYAPVPDRLTAGQEVFERRLATSGTQATGSGSVRLSYFTAREAADVASVRVLSGSTAAGATPSLARIGVYEESDTGDLTLVASTANDTTLLAAANTAYTKALSVPFTTKRSRRYAVGLIVVTAATAPTMTGAAAGTAMASELAVAPRLSALRSGQADLPASIAAVDLTATSVCIYAALLP